jgi:hypothetical protein
MFSSITRRVYSNIRASTAIPSISFCRQTAFEPNITKKSTQSKATELLHAHLYHKNDFGTVFAGVATVAAVVGAAKMWWDASGSGNNKGYANRELSREELKEILLELGTGLQQLTVRSSCNSTKLHAYYLIHRIIAVLQNTRAKFLNSSRAFAKMLRSKG